MNEFLQAHTWMAHLTFWWCFKFAFILLIGGIAGWFLLWCLLTLLGAALEIVAQRWMRRQRRKSYRVGDSITPKVTRAWLAAMRERR